MVIAGRRAIMAYFQSLKTGQVIWDKTVHEGHPASALLRRVQA